MDKDQLKQWFQKFLQVLTEHGINVHSGIDSLRLGVYENISKDPNEYHFKSRDAVDYREPSKDIKQFLAGKKKYEDLNDEERDNVFDVDGLLSHKPIADIDEKEQEELFKKVQKGEFYIISPDFNVQKHCCVYIGDAIEGDEYPIYTQDLSKNVGLGFSAQEEDEIEAYLKDDHYVFKDQNLGKHVKAAKASIPAVNINNEDAFADYTKRVFEFIEQSRKREVFPGIKSLDIVDKYYEFLRLSTSMSVDLSEDKEGPEQEGAEIAENQPIEDEQERYKHEQDMHQFQMEMAKAKKSWKTCVLRDFNNHPEFYADPQHRKQRSNEFFYSSVAESVHPTSVEIFSEAKLQEFKAQANTLNSAAMLDLDDALWKISNEAFGAQVHKLDQLFESNRVIHNGHVYTRGENEVPWKIYDDVAMDIVSGIEVCVKTDEVEDGHTVCYSINFMDGELKLAKGTTVLMTEEEKAANKKELKDFCEALNNLGDTSRDSKEYKALKEKLTHAVDHFSEISSVGRYNRLRNEIADAAAMYYVAKADQPMNSRRSGRFRVAEDLFIYPEKFENEAQRLENRIASKMVSAKLHELMNASGWQGSEAKLALMMPSNFKTLLTEVKAQPEFQALVEGKSEKELRRIFESSPAKLLATNEKSVNAILSSLRAKHYSETIVDSEYKNREEALDKLGEFTGILNKLSGPKDSKEFVDIKEQLENTLSALKNTKDDATIQSNLQDLRTKSMKYFATKISEGMRHTRPNRVRAAMYIANTIDSLAGKKGNSLLASTGVRGTLETLLAARLTKQSLQNAAKKNPDAKRILEDPDALADNCKNTFESADFQNFLLGKSDSDLADLMSISSTDLCNKVSKNVQKAASKPMLNNVKLMGKYTALQAGTQPFTTSEELRELDKNNPLHLSVTRQIVMSLCKAKMIQDGYSIDDALNPKLLGDVKRDYAKDIMSLIKEGKSQEIFDIMKAGCVAIDNQLKTCLGEIKSLDEIITNEKYKNVVSMGYVFKDLHQDIKHLPNELQAQNKKDIDDLATDVDSLAPFTDILSMHLKVTNKFLEGDRKLLGHCTDNLCAGAAPYMYTNSIFKEIAKKKGDNGDLMSYLTVNGEPTEYLEHVKAHAFYIPEALKGNALFKNVKTPADLKMVGEKLLDESIGFDIVYDEKLANTVRINNGDKLDRAIQNSVSSKQAVK